MVLSKRRSMRGSMSEEARMILPILHLIVQKPSQGRNTYTVHLFLLDTCGKSERFHYKLKNH
jgi:hypothetical protein